MIEQLKLTARRVSPLHFICCPVTWTKELKPVSTAKWTHDTAPQYSTHNYELKSGAFLVFPEFGLLHGGFYAAHVYAVVKNMDCKQIQGTITVEGLTLESLGGEVKTRVTLKPRGISKDCTAYHAVLNY